jgi:hypothetical protein
MATALVVTPEQDYGSACFDAFRARGVFPVVISTIDRAILLLKQFRVDVLVVHSPADAGNDSDCARLRELAAGTPTLVLPELPEPHALAVHLRDVIRASVQRELTTSREPTADGSRASSSSRGGSSA